MVNLALMTAEPTVCLFRTDIVRQRFQSGSRRFSADMLASPQPAVCCRQIEEGDIAGVAALLTRGFPGHSGDFWLGALQELARRESPPGLPKFGYLMESRGVPVGAVLLICSKIKAGDASGVRCNLSSWYVEPDYRAYAALLISRALRHKNVTYMNISAAPHTRPIIEAQGFSRYCDGIFVALPMLNPGFGGDKAKVHDVRWQPNVAFDRTDQEILLQHAAHGCSSLWCATSEHAYPFVFRLRFVKRVVPCAQMIYCRDIGDIVRFAAPIGRYLALRGRPFVIIDSNGPIPGLIGVYRRDSMPKYFKGPLRPRLGDLAYTECALLGI